MDGLPILKKEIIVMKPDSGRRRWRAMCAWKCLRHMETARQTPINLYQESGCISMKQAVLTSRRLL